MIYKQKSGQMKIQQMAFMLIAVTLFFVLVGLFFAMIIFSNLRESAELLEEKNAMLLVTKLANSPEFSCENSFGEIKINCIDFYKVLALKDKVNRYTGFWGVSGIEIRRIYPAGTGIECTSSNPTDCDIIRLIPGTGTGVSSFVVMCRHEDSGDGFFQEKCELAKLIVYYGGGI